MELAVPQKCKNPNFDNVFSAFKGIIRCTAMTKQGHMTEFELLEDLYKKGSTCHCFKQIL